MDKRGVVGYLERFMELIVSRGAARGAWRGDVSDGEVT
jgi:hypothetical protein